MNRDAEIEQAVFEAARLMDDPAAREEFLNRVYRDDPAAGERMRALLSADSDSADWFDTATTARDEVASTLASSGSPVLPSRPLEGEPVPERVGEHFILRERLGEGGSGRVFRAEQTEPVQRSVAVKFLRPVLSAIGFFEAFQRECRALARLNHPNIAAIIEAGSTESGVPYFVMELVEGAHITTDCDARRETIEGRILLFLDVCAAISHAHRKGVIHRDLKPANIVVTSSDGKPSPKVIDFGIAAGVDASRNAGAPAAPPSGTPGYMSPEQRNPDRTDIDTRTDVFSLGVILRELLAGARPDATPPPDDPVSAWLKRLPAPRLDELATRRGLRSQRFVATLRGDLDAIIDKATATDREARYESVEALAIDLRRHLDGWPIRARPRHPRYILGKFFLRNRIACSFAVGAALIVMLSAAGVFVSYLHERKARREADEAREVADALLQKSLDRETFSKAAILISWARVDEAEALLRDHPGTDVEPSREVAYVFRELGQHKARQGRWTESAAYFQNLAKAISREAIDKVAREYDLLFMAPAFLEAGNQADYDALRTRVLSNERPILEPVRAVNMVKTCLLRPASPAELERIRPVVAVLAETVRQTSDPELRSDSGYAPWYALALALFEYREGRFESAADWTHRYTESAPGGTARFRAQSTAMRWIESMACRRLGRTACAEAAAREARDMTAAYSRGVVAEDFKHYSSANGTWYEWALTRVLQREAEATVESTAGKTPADAGFRAPGL